MIIIASCPTLSRLCLVSALLEYSVPPIDLHSLPIHHCSLLDIPFRQNDYHESMAKAHREKWGRPCRGSSSDYSERWILGQGARGRWSVDLLFLQISSAQYQDANE